MAKSELDKYKLFYEDREEYPDLVKAISVRVKKRALARAKRKKRSAEYAGIGNE